MGDALTDLKMIDGINYDNLISIGFFAKNKDSNDYQKERDKFEKGFDLVIDDNDDFDKVIKLFNKINSN